MSHLRWNPLLGTWTLMAANRQNRPNLPSGCPFCPGSPRVPNEYTVLVYDNDFPALSLAPPPVEETSTLATTAPAYGKCEVILFSSDHNKSLWQLTNAHIAQIVNLWADRTRALQADDKIKYVFPFENRGQVVGVTIHHPHGQLYAYPFVPLKLATELQNCRNYFEQTKCNLWSVLLAEELQTKQRIFFENEDFIAFIPHFTDYPYGMFIAARHNIVSLAELTSQQAETLADCIKRVTTAFEHLFNKPFPYMMCVHQAPCNSPEWGNVHDYYRLHIEFYPPYRADETVKYYASSEMGAWAAANTRLPEETTQELIAAYNRFGVL